MAAWAACVWKCAKYHLGFWGAMALIGLIMAGLAALGVTTGGAGLTGLPALIALLEAVWATAFGAAGLKLAIAGGTGMIATLAACMVRCF